MLGKLLKYEFKATGRIFGPLFGALLLLSLVTRLLGSLRFETPAAIGIVLSVIMMMGVFVITLIITLQRFYRNLLTNEGYLMFTLPVKTDSLILSKLIVAFVWSVLSLFVVTAAILMMTVTEFDLPRHLAMLKVLHDRAGISMQMLSIFVIELSALALLSLFCAILFVYACMSLSLLVNKHKILFSFGAFLVFNTIGQILITACSNVVMATKFPQIFKAWEYTDQIQFMMLAAILFILIAGAFYYTLTRYMLKSRLNLE